MVALSVLIGVTSAEPTVEIDGQAQPQLNAGLLSLLVEETTEGLARCEARWGNWGSVDHRVDYLYFDRSQLDFGKTITVSMGQGEGKGVVFTGVISAIEGQFPQGEPPQVVVLAEDAAQNLRVTRRSRTFEHVTDAYVIEKIADDHGLTPDIRLPGPTHAVVAQLNQSDLAFIRERAQQAGAELWIQDGVLHVQDRLTRQQGGDKLSLDYNRGLLEFSVVADTANQYTQVVVSGWDVQAKATLKAEATDQILATELQRDDSGASVVKAMHQDRIDRITHPHPLTSMEARTLAEATFRAQARRFVVGTGRAWGDARIRVGRVIDFRGLGPLFSGVYYVTEVRHWFSRAEDGGYTTEFVVERAGLGPGSSR